MTIGNTANLLSDFYDRLPEAVAEIVPDPEPCTQPGAFSPGFALPELDDALAGFLAPATAAWHDIATYEGHRIVLLDLTGNPGTHTTKTFASLLIVARAIEFIRRSGEPVVIFSPTSANKGTALRDAALGAYDAGLATPEELRIVVLAPAGCRPKLRSSRLSQNPDLRALNPLLLYGGAQSEDVKTIGKEFVEKYAERLRSRTGAHLWFSLELRNYLVADTARAFFEHAVDPPSPDGPGRWHAHAVSSAFGLLGYHLGRQVLERSGEVSAATRPASLLVQHLGTPDMVLSLRTGSFDRSGVPAYAPGDDGLLRQNDDPRFPATTYASDEVLDPTFYTRRPATSTSMNDIIGRFGGDGIVVSLHECLERYPFVRSCLATARRPLPPDPRELREWSVVMALTGALNAIDRGLIPAGDDVVVHGTGWYTSTDYEPPGPDEATPVMSVDDIAAAVVG
ncbi:MAG TPA: DUF6002 family protein [Actinopolymorphaceae bacterium]